MSKSLVVYKNTLNKFSFDGKLSENEQVILFSIFKESKEKNTNIVQMSYKNFKNNVDNLIKRMSLDDFDLLLKKISKLHAESINGIGATKKIIYFNFFDNIIINREDDLITFKLSDTSMYFFNNIKRGFTQWELLNFSDIKGKYNRIIFRFLKTFASTGIWRIKYNDFKKILNLPKTYRSNDIEFRVLKKAIEELCPKYFTNLTIEKVKEGRSIQSLIFSFDKQPLTEEQKKMYKEFKKLSPLEQASYNNEWQKMEEILENIDDEEIKPTRNPNKLFE